VIAALLLSAAVAGPVQAAPAPAAADFGALSRQAAAARDAGKLDEAASLYRRALALRPAWDEGQWYLGTVLYEGKKAVDCEQAFARFVELLPQAGPGWALRGMCAFDAGQHAAAATHLEKSLQLGLGGNEELLRATRRRLALALLRSGQFERAVEGYTNLARTNPETAPGLLEEIGLLLLRAPMLPADIPQERLPFVRQVGRAGYLHLALRGEEAKQAYAELVAQHPKEPWLHYAYGVFLLRSDSELALAELRRELEVQPDNVMAQLEIAYELILRGDHAGARPYAEKAVALAPQLFAAQNALGRALVETGSLQQGIRHLEEAARLAPESPEMFFALGRAYARAGRQEDAARARARFAELDRQRREKKVGERDPGRPPAAEEPR
jgi:tetratricopeptide (TPR) repeat protein